MTQRSTHDWTETRELIVQILDQSQLPMVAVSETLHECSKLREESQFKILSQKETNAFAMFEQLEEAQDFLTDLTNFDQKKKKKGRKHKFGSVIAGSEARQTLPIICRGLRLPLNICWALIQVPDERRGENKVVLMHHLMDLLPTV